METTLPIIYTDRTRIEEFQRCPRKRYWGYHYQLPEMAAAGMQPAKPALELSVGSAVHKGVEWLMKVAGRYSKYEEADLVVAVKDGLEEFDSIWQPWLNWAEANKVNSYYDEDTATTDNFGSNPLLTYQLAEARAQIEALIAAFYYSPLGLELLVNNYDILAVEQEIQVPLASWLVLNSRPDAILRHRSTGQYFAWSLKTAKQWSDRTNEQAEVDNQGISESIATEWWLRNEGYVQLRLDNLDATCSGVLMCYLIKSEKRAEEDPTTGTKIYRNQSPLIRPYYNNQAFDAADYSNYAASSYYQCVEEHEYRWAKDGYKVNGKNGCPGGKWHKRGDQWQRVNLWEVPGVSISDWVKELFLQDPDRGLEFVQVPAPYKRGREEQQRWKNQVAAQEHRIAEAVEEVQFMLLKGYDQSLALAVTQNALDAVFPQSRTSCIYPFRCNFFDICHKGGQQQLLDPALFQRADDAEDLPGLSVIDQLGYRERQPNHPEAATSEVTV